MAQTARLAAASFERTLDRLGTHGLGDPKELGYRAALLVTAEQAWTRHLGTWLSLDAVRALLGDVTRQAVHDLMKRGRLLALDRQGARVYPAFQFKGTKLLPGLPALLAAFKPADLSHDTIAAWLNRPQPALRGSSPAEWLHAGRDQAPVALAARRTAARLAH